MTDASNNNNGFKDGANVAVEYEYDSFGNMTVDRNKGIANITYNHLNLPSRITFTGTTDYIQYLYTAEGTKLKKEWRSASTINLLPIALLMADKYNNDNARSTVYFQMVMLNNGGKIDDNSFFNLAEVKQDFVASYLIDGTLNGSPGCRSILQKIVKSGCKVKYKKQKIDSLLNLKA